ncbi:uncharacterized protein F54H12.2-like [Haliotis asinina]|uniref:uncharacterized protein F54H12.2-like n=1 Tax=Haliotis asinina TaxID=109174 RepID=UPI0035319DD7
MENSLRVRPIYIPTRVISRFFSTKPQHRNNLYYNLNSITKTDSMDESDPNSANGGLFLRYTRNGTVDMCGPLYEDLMDSKRYWINGVDLQIRMFRTPPAFNLMCAEDSPSYKVKIQDIYLRMCKIRPSSAITTSHAKVLSHHTAKYPFTKSDIKTVSLPKGQLNYTVDNLFQNKVPNKTVVALASSEAVNGSYTKSPFNFQMYDLSSIVLYVDGESLPGEALRVAKKQYITAYNALFEGRASIGLDIERGDFKGGYALYQFCLEPYHLKDDYLDLIKRGNLRLNLQFSKALPETTNLILYSEDNLMLTVDNARNILYSTP